jgi:hypothetical protein
MPFNGVPAGIEESTNVCSFLPSDDISPWAVGETLGGVVNGCVADEDGAEGDFVELASADFVDDVLKARRESGGICREFVARRRQRRQIMMEELRGV